MKRVWIQGHFRSMPGDKNLTPEQKKKLEEATKKRQEAECAKRTKK